MDRYCVKMEESLNFSTADNINNASSYGWFMLMVYHDIYHGTGSTTVVYRSTKYVAVPIPNIYCKLSIIV